MGTQVKLPKLDTFLSQIIIRGVQCSAHVRPRIDNSTFPTFLNERLVIRIIVNVQVEIFIELDM